MAWVLIIEDDLDMREWLAEVLAAAGHQVLTANNGEDGLCLLQDKAPYLDLIVTDILMPEKNGFQVLWELHSMKRGPKVIAISGAPAQWMVLETAEDLGARMTLSKPFTPNDMVQAVASVLASD